MRVAFVSRASLYDVPGGDTIQMQNTARELRKLGYEIKLFTSNQQIKYEEFDLLHFFNIIRPAEILQHINKSKLPYVLSPIYVDYAQFEKTDSTGLRKLLNQILNKHQIEYLKVIARAIVNGDDFPSIEYLFKGHKSSIKKVLKNCSHLLPNSKSEFNRLSNDFPNNTEYTVVPNAINTQLFSKKEVERIPDRVICAARIEGRKNQLRLIEAIKQTSLKLVIIGKAAPNHQNYLKLCKEKANEQVEFIEELNQEELNIEYQKAAVHAMPSWFETTGLSSLEAAYCGCSIVVSDKGDERDYFQSEAIYADPNSIQSIKNALLQAVKNDASKELKNRIEIEYTWVRTAEKTAEAYKKVLL